LLGRLLGAFVPEFLTQIAPYFTSIHFPDFVVQQNPQSMHVCIFLD